VIQEINTCGFQYTSFKAPGNERVFQLLSRSDSILIAAPRQENLVITDVIFLIRDAGCTYIQGVSGGIVNILGGCSIDYSE
jgi:hypothetical protein